ncbi:hypothetical protein ACEPAI_2252 [Sanghuangporus weigelae]
MFLTPLRSYLLSHLRALLDSDALNLFPDGNVEIKLPPEEIDERMVKAKADLLSELVCIMRSEFEDASSLIARTCNLNLFNTFAACITLRLAHLARSLGDTVCASQCYGMVAHLAAEGTFVDVSAWSGGLAFRIANGEGNRMDLASSRRSSLWHVCLSKEIFTAKSHLKSALDLASSVQDKHLCALVFAVISISYFHTAEQHSRPMLETCAQLAAGPGAPQTQPSSSPSKEDPGSTVVSVNNTPLGLWVGQRFLDDVKARHQESIMRGFKLQ